MCFSLDDNGSECTKIVVASMEMSHLNRHISRQNVLILFCIPFWLRDTSLSDYAIFAEQHLHINPEHFDVIHMIAIYWSCLGRDEVGKALIKILAENIRQKKAKQIFIYDFVFNAFSSFWQLQIVTRRHVVVGSFAIGSGRNAIFWKLNSQESVTLNEMNNIYCIIPHDDNLRPTQFARYCSIKHSIATSGMLCIS